MALRDQPYIPLYVQDFLTDEKLVYCSASATGVYIRLMCIMHKSEEYGKILLKQNFKQDAKQVKNFATQLAVQMPYSLLEIENAIIELTNEKVLHIDGDYLLQKRMVRDCELSDIRASAGRSGGKRTQRKASKSTKNEKDFACDFAKAKNEANTENENEYENEYESNSIKGGVGENIETLAEMADKIAANEAKLDNRLSIFREQCAEYVPIYGKEMIRAFFNYWTEPNKTKTKMRFELERTWDLKRRLTTWSNNETKFKKDERNNNSQRTQSGVSDDYKRSILERLHASGSTG